MLFLIFPEYRMHMYCCLMLLLFLIPFQGQARATALCWCPMATRPSQQTHPSTMASFEQSECLIPCLVLVGTISYVGLNIFHVENDTALYTLPASS
jgi:hypothetical protein